MFSLSKRKPKVLMLIGTRPEAIKMAPVYLALKATGRLQVRLVSTGQHGSLLHDALRAFGISVDRDLKLMEPGQSLTRLVGRALTSLDMLFQEEAPDHVLVHGDTATGFAGALACFYGGLACSHVEAGLRTYRLDAPFPEEFHRQVVAKAATVHFAPTLESAHNLRAEGVDEERIVVTGSTSVDAVEHVLNCSEALPSNQKLVLVTAHRRENGGAGLARIMKAVKRLAQTYPDFKFVLPVHPNPAVQKAVLGVLPAPANLVLVSPLDYGEFVNLMAQSSLILTDSGGIQEEAAFLQKRVLLLRDTTERPEAVSCGSAKLVGTSLETILREAGAILKDGAGQPRENPFGEVGAAQRIAQFLMTRLLPQTEYVEAA